MKKIVVAISFMGAVGVGIWLSSCAQMDGSYGDGPMGRDGWNTSNNSGTRGSSMGSFYSSAGGGSGGGLAALRDLEQSWGASAELALVSREAFEEFRLGVPLNSLDDISDLRVFVKLEKADTNYSYGGSVSIIYVDYARPGQEGEAFRTTYKSGSGNRTRYNRWFRDSLGNRSFHGFFQETDGALVLVD